MKKQDLIQLFIFYTYYYNTTSIDGRRICFYLCLSVCLSTRTIDYLLTFTVIL